MTVDLELRSEDKKESEIRNWGVEGLKKEEKQELVKLHHRSGHQIYFGSRMGRGWIIVSLLVLGTHAVHGAGFFGSLVNSVENVFTGNHAPGPAGECLS